MAVVCLLAAALPLPLRADDPSAWELFERGREAEKAGHIAEAYVLYSEAAAMDPKNRSYWQRSQAIRTRAALEGLVMPQAATADAGGADLPEEQIVKPEDATPQDLAAARRKLPPAALAPPAAADVVRDIDLRGDSKEVWTGAAKLFGLDCVFDGDYQPLPPMRFQLTAVDYRVAIRGLEAATGTFIIPLTPKIFLVAKDTPQKRAELQPRVAISIPLPNSVTQQDFNQAVTAVQQAVGIDKISFDTQSRTVIIRDTLAKATAARALFEDLVRPPAQVSIELKLMEVTRNDMVTYGIDFPNIFTLSALTNWFNNQFTPPSSISGLLTFGGGKTLMGIGILTPALVAQMSKSNGASLLHSELRATDGQPATMHIGEQYPVLTSQYLGPASFTAGGTAYTPPPAFQFVDLGLTLKVTPSVRSLAEATLDVDAEYKVLTGASVNSIPVIGNRAFKTTISLRLGDWAVVGGLLDVNEAHSIAGLAGLSRVPYLGALTSTRTKTHNTDQILLLMRAVPLSIPPSETASGRVYRMGTETRPFTMM